MMRLAAIWRHPVKSLGAEGLNGVTLRAGEALPGDRAYAVTHGKSDVTGDAWASCDNFLRVTNIPALARPVLAFNPETETLTVTDEGEAVSYALDTVDGRKALSAWMGVAAGTIRPGPYKVESVSGTSLTDVPEQCPSVMSLASLRDLSARVGTDLDMRRFRGNLWIDGETLAPWAELDWSGKTLTIGEARLAMTEPIERCLAIATDPATGTRVDNPMPALKSLGADPLFGMLAMVEHSGEVAVGDTVTLE
jgi:uncharacterized protein YcbX